jgi:hypothetical protein
LLPEIALLLQRRILLLWGNMVLDGLEGFGTVD